MFILNNDSGNNVTRLNCGTVKTVGGEAMVKQTVKNKLDYLLSVTKCSLIKII